MMWIFFSEMALAQFPENGFFVQNSWIGVKRGVTSFKNRFENQPKSIDLTLLSFEFLTLSRTFLLSSDRNPFRIELHVKDAAVGCFKINSIKGLYSKFLHVI